MKTTANESLFLQWMGDKPYTVENAKDYLRYLQESNLSRNSKRVRWHTCKAMFRKYSGMTEKEFHCEILWLSKQARFSGVPPQPVRRLTDHEFQTVLEYTLHRSARIALFMKVIRRHDLKISEVCRIRAYPPSCYKVDADLLDEVRKVFNGQQWLFETSTGRDYHKDYVSSQIAKYTISSLGFRAGCEAIRPPKD